MPGGRLAVVVMPTLTRGLKMLLGYSDSAGVTCTSAPVSRRSSNCINSSLLRGETVRSLNLFENSEAALRRQTSNKALVSVVKVESPLG